MTGLLRPPGLYVYDVVKDMDKQPDAYVPIEHTVAAIDRDGERWLIDLVRGFPRVYHSEQSVWRKLALFPEMSNGVIFRTVDGGLRP